VPFTLSHPAAVLPLRRYRLPLSALGAGSIAPDLPHVLFLNEVSRYGHTLPGLFLVSLPAGLAALVIFELLLKRPLLALSPDAVRLRIAADNFALRRPSQITWILTSLVLGLFTHAVWDSFTHSGGLLVATWPVLRESTPFWPYRPIFKFLQPLFSIMGLAAIAFAHHSWIRGTPLFQVAVPPVASRVGRYAFLITGTLTAGAFGLIYSHFSFRVIPVGFGTLVEHFLFGSMAAGFLLILLFSLWWHLRAQSLPTTTDQIGGETSS
jgi:Domain of unknown function (DUF4184)